MELRRCTRADLPGLEWGGVFTCHRQVFEEAFAAQERDEGVIWLAVQDDEPVGQVFVDTRHDEGVALLWAVRVRPELRGRGLGARLMAVAEGALQDDGVEQVELVVEKHNTGARRFYERDGYRVVGERVDRWGTTTPDGVTLDHELDTWVMRKELRARAA